MNRVNESMITNYLIFTHAAFVEMAGNIIMGYLLLLDAERNRNILPCRNFIRQARSENVANISFINNFSANDLSGYKNQSYIE